MAMRPTTGGGTARTRLAATVQPVYENFRPVTESTEDEESNSLLLIYLPGFQKEQLKVSTEGRNTLRVRGERFVAGNKWSRFQEAYPLPEDCNIKGIRARFEGGILTIKVPKKREAEDASKTAPKPIEKDAPKPTQKTHEKVPDDGMGVSEKIPSVSELARGRVSEKVSDTPLAPDQKMSSELARGRVSEKVSNTLSASDQKMSSEKPRVGSIEKLENSKEKRDRPKRASWEEDGIKKTVEEPKAQKDLRPLMKSKKAKEESDYQNGALERKQVPRKIEKKSEEQREITAGKIKKASNQVENITRKGAEEPKSHKDDGDHATASSLDHGRRNYKQAVRKVLDLNEERQLLVNVGAAVLVIVAFAAYLSNSIQEKLRDV